MHELNLKIKRTVATLYNTKPLNFSPTNYDLTHLHNAFKQQCFLVRSCPIETIWVISLTMYKFSKILHISVCFLYIEEIVLFWFKINV